MATRGRAAFAEGDELRLWRYGWLYPTLRPCTVPAYSEQAEELWMPRLGPTAMALVRWVHRHAPHGGAAAPVVVPAGELALALGVSPAVLSHTLDRLCRLRVAVQPRAGVHEWALAEMWPEPDRRERRVA